MDLRVNEVKLPEQIIFNYEELKQDLTEKVNHYETLVYTNEQIKDAKADKATLNKLKKALNDERIRREKEYMQPFNDFKAKINEIISIIDKPVALIDKQVKEFEDKQKQEKKQKIIDYWSEQTQPSFLTFEQIFDEKWLNASASMKSIQEAINNKIAQVSNDVNMLQNLPEFSFEATEVYKTTLDINKAITEAKRMSDIAKKKAEQEAEAKARVEAAQAQKKEYEKPEIIEIPNNAVVTEDVAANNQTPEQAKKQWMSFKALLAVDEAQELSNYFRSKNITFEVI